MGILAYTRAHEKTRNTWNIVSVQIFNVRIDSPFLLPVRGRCLMKMLPVLDESNGNREETTQHGSETGTNRSSA